MMRVTSAVLAKPGAPRPYTDSAPLTLETLDLDAPGAGELLIRVRAAGLCHSDLSTLEGTRPRPTPMALGHEAAGEVVEVGAGVSGFEAGDHVVLAFVPSCADCVPCRGGRPALCEPGAVANAEGVLLGGGRRLRRADGTLVHHHLGVSAFSDHVVVSARSAVHIDADLPWEIAALFGCAVLTGVGAAVNAARVALGDSVAVFGLGGVGLAALMGALAAGASPVFAVDREAAKLALAEELGATRAIDAADDPVATIRALSGGGVRHAIETVGKAAVLMQTYEATARGGTTTTVGLPHPSESFAVPAVTLTAEERTVQGCYLGSCIPSRDIPRFVRLYKEGRLPVERLLTHVLGPHEINAGFERLASGEGVRQIVLFPDEAG